MPKKLNIQGKRFGRLLVVAPAGSKKGRTRWHCVCECKGKNIVMTQSLISGRSKSCGCLAKESIKKIGKGNITHGMSKTPECGAYRQMLRRCYNKNCLDYARWGGRGIRVCDSWLNNIETFFKDMGNRPDGTSIERTDNKKGYNKENCKWATKSEQGINRGVFKNNKSGATGVCWLRVLSKWSAQIKRNNITYVLGNYYNFYDAVKIRRAAENDLICW